MTANGALRVLLISANTEKLPDPVFPIGAAYIAAAAERAGHSVETLDLCFLDTPDSSPEKGDSPFRERGITAELAQPKGTVPFFRRSVRRALERKIRDFAPQVVGISLRNLDSSSYPENTSYIDDYKSLVDDLRELTAAPIVLGGAGFTVMPQTIMEYLHADVGVIGEGEMTFPWVLERLAAGESVRSGPGISCETVNGGVCVRPATRLKELDRAGVPSRRHFDMDRYYERGGALNLQTKRGCYFECVFCSYPLIEGSTVRMRTPGDVVDEIEAMREEFGIRHWFFVDNIFNMPIRHCKEICEEIVRRSLDIEWSAYLNPKFVDEELCRLMARSGCRAIEFGTDSGSPAMMKNLKKEFEVEDLRRTSRLCHAYGLKFCHSLILGGPGETTQTVTETIDLMEEIKPTAVIALVGIRILPGTEMVEIALRDEQMDPDDNLLYPKFYISPTFAGDLVDLVEAHARARSNWIVPGKGIKTNIRMLQKLRERKIKGQLWRLLR